MQAEGQDRDAGLQALSFPNRLQQAASHNGSWLIVGLDPVLDKLPDGVTRDPDGVLDFNRKIIAATQDLVIGYKLNFAFYEALGSAGWDVLAATRASIPHPLLTVADAKRGDIPDTAAVYAASIFDSLGFDAVTVSPYVGREGIMPFLARKSRGAFVLCRTSNRDTSFQTRETAEGPIFEMVAREAPRWGRNVGLVAGGTDIQALARIRSLAPSTPLLIPGIGAQGGNLRKAVAAGEGVDGGRALYAASRSVLYASSGPDWIGVARREAGALRDVIRGASQG